MTTANTLSAAACLGKRIFDISLYCVLMFRVVYLQQTAHGGPASSHQSWLQVNHSNNLTEVFLYLISSFYHSTMFVLGSVLGWAILSRSLSSSLPVRCLSAVGKNNNELFNLQLINSSSFSLQLCHVKIILQCSQSY